MTYTKARQIIKNELKKASEFFKVDMSVRHINFLTKQGLKFVRNKLS